MRAAVAIERRRLSTPAPAEQTTFAADAVARVSSPYNVQHNNNVVYDEKQYYVRGRQTIV